MEKIIKIIYWVFVLIGAIVVTKMCLFNMGIEDTTSIFLGLALINIVWIAVGIGLKETLENKK